MINGLFRGTYDPIKNRVKYEFIPITTQPVKQKDEAWREENQKKQAAGVRFEIDDIVGWAPGIFNFIGKKEGYREVPRQKENSMKETIPHLALRRQWLNDIEKDPKCVWRWRDKGLSDWISLSPGVEPVWDVKREYSPQPKTKTYYMVMVKHKGAMVSPFGLVFENKEDIDGYLNNFHLAQVGDVVSREVEQ